MTAQLSLVDLPAVRVACPVPRPCGLEVREIDGVKYLADFGPENWFRVMGWYYGYPSCCVDAFIDRDVRQLAAHGDWLDRQSWDAPMLGNIGDPRPEPEPRPHHPVSGHLLCPACEAGPMAPLPSRPADRYGFVFFRDGEPPDVRPPSPRARFFDLARVQESS